MSLREAIATPAGKAPYVRRLFGTIADRYDLITVLLSYGQDRRWKRRLLDLAGPLDGLRVLDLACGTGDISYGAAARGAWVAGLDLTPRMIEIAAAKAPSAQSGSRVRFLVGDMLSLPFPDARFDVVTTGYGLRNVPVLDDALDEIARVLRPGGLFLSLDFNRPDLAPVRGAYHAYLTLSGSLLGLVLHGDPDTYRYIPESIRRYPGADAVARLLSERGFAPATWQRVLGGLLAIHVGRRRRHAVNPPADPRTCPY
jgi:demethylmenaquinone methyltransferase / 2-methoxy-6-polyprenyl-1,4-benzoquinol methylase